MTVGWANLELFDALEQCRGLIPEDRRSSCVDLVVNDAAIAFEILCSNLRDCDAVVNDVLYAKLERVGAELRVRDDYWKRLSRAPYRG